MLLNIDSAVHHDTLLAEPGMPASSKGPLHPYHLPGQTPLARPSPSSKSSIVAPQEPYASDYFTRWA